MTINEMFNMAKGQTLTQDGCEADVDDKRYNIGDISQKTGLQKTANGWVKPKNGKAPGAKTAPGESPKGKADPQLAKEIENGDHLEKFDIEKWKTGPKVEKNSKLDWSHGVVGKSISVQGKSAEEKRNLINKYNSVGRLSRIGTKKNSYYNNKYGTFEVAGIDNDNVYIQETAKNGLGSTYTVLRTIPLNEVEEINPFHDYGKRNPDTGEESPTRPPIPEDCAPRVLTKDTKIRVRKA